MRFNIELFSFDRAKSHRRHKVDREAVEAAEKMHIRVDAARAQSAERAWEVQ